MTLVFTVFTQSSITKTHRTSLNDFLALSQISRIPVPMKFSGTRTGSVGLVCDTFWHSRRQCPVYTKRANAPFSVNIYTKRNEAALHSHFYIISNISGVTVQRSSGEVNILAKTVVSSISLKATFTKLIPKQVAQKSRNNI